MSTGIDAMYPTRLPQPTQVSRNIRAGRPRASGKGQIVAPDTLRSEATLNAESEAALSNAGTPVRSKEQDGVEGTVKVRRSRQAPTDIIRQEFEKEQSKMVKSKSQERDQTWLDTHLTSERFKQSELNGFTQQLQQALSSAQLSSNSDDDHHEDETQLLAWSVTEEKFRIADGMRLSKLDATTLLPILQDRLYFHPSSAEPSAEKAAAAGVHHVSIDDEIQYQPFCGDFGPFNLGMTHAFCQQMRQLLADPEHTAHKIILRPTAIYTSSTSSASTTCSADEMTNAIYLIGAFLTLHLGATVAQAWRPFENIEQCPCLPYRDATWAPSSFDLPVTACWAGLAKAREKKLYDPATFRVKEYAYYDDPRNGDMHEVVPGQFIAFKGPTAERFQVGHSLLPTDYADVFRAKRVRTVVRLNESRYDRLQLVREGFHHVDLPFTDCSTPPDDICDRFLRVCEQSEGVVAVHCLAGLGRTGTLIAAWMIKHLGFSAVEAMAWLRIVRPGSVIGPQQNYLTETEGRLLALKARGVGGFGLGEEPGDNLKLEEEEEQRRRRESQLLRDSNANALAEMVRNGMAKRDNVRGSRDGLCDGTMTPVEPLQQQQSVTNGRRAGGVGQLQVESSADGPLALSANEPEPEDSLVTTGNRPGRRSGRESRDFQVDGPGAMRESCIPASAVTALAAVAEEGPAADGNVKVEVRNLKGDLTVTESREHLRQRLLAIKARNDNLNDLVTGSQQDMKSGGPGPGSISASRSTSASGGNLKPGARQSWPVQGGGRGALRNQGYHSVFGSQPVAGPSNLKSSKARTRTSVA